MKRELLIFIATVSLWSFSCNKEVIGTQSNKTLSQNDIYQSVMNLSFIEECVVPEFPFAKGKQPASLAITYSGYSTRADDPAFMKKKYHEIKNQIVSWIEEDPDGINASLSHNIALNYLRFCFLPLQGKEAQQETLFLLDLIMSQGAIDLDIMADAYIKVHKKLPIEKQEAYLNHIRSVYFKDMEFIKNNWKKMRDDYEKDTNPELKNWYLMKGKFWERTTKSGTYANELLGLTDSMKN
ncbi:MAG: hypothetical protein IPK21_22670 [Haliscomenobacter sp.]|nr:hypothetical protein [Haliscomenobacter sp.]